MDNLVIKNVEFCNTELLAIQEKETGKIYAGINCILRELGFDDGQIRYRRDKWIDDKSIGKGVRKFLHPYTDGGLQETYCIDVMKLPLAIAKIEITPKMEQNIPDLSKKLEKYQDECADVLAAAFLQKEKEVSALERLALCSQAILEVNEKVENVEQRVDRLEYDAPLYAAEADELCQAVKKKGTQLLGGKKSNAYRNSKLRDSVYRNIYNAIKYQFDLRDSSGKYKSYKALQRKHFRKALELVKEYDLPIFLKEKVENENAQINLEVA